MTSAYCSEPCDHARCNGSKPKVAAPDVVFRKVREQHGWLSNMSPHPVNFEGYEWRTAEHLFQALRFRAPDLWVRTVIRQQHSPMGAKMTAKSHLHNAVVVPRSPEDLDNMRAILRLKIEQHPTLRKMLVATGEARLIEDVSARPNESGLYWGMKWVPAQIVEGLQIADGRWEGQNKLGELWAEVRKEIAG